MNTYKIKACRANEFIPLFQELQNFTKAKQTGQLINNVPRLLGLLENYFRGLLYYIHNNKSSYVVEIDKKYFKLKLVEPIKMEIKKNLT